jgi:catechol 2,3-dioxygenase-like lactoylglutathione lyase family enzyme
VIGHIHLKVGDAEEAARFWGAALGMGETARYAVDCQHSIRNPGKSLATGWLVVVHPA